MDRDWGTHDSKAEEFRAWVAKMYELMDFGREGMLQRDYSLVQDVDGWFDENRLW
jgi:hypothetical protein